MKRDRPWGFCRDTLTGYLDAAKSGAIARLLSDVRAMTRSLLEHILLLIAGTVACSGLELLYQHTKSYLVLAFAAATILAFATYICACWVSVGEFLGRPLMRISVLLYFLVIIVAFVSTFWIGDQLVWAVNAFKSQKIGL